MAQYQRKQKHPHKDIEEALQYAEDNDWIVEPNKRGHAWGKMKCPQNNVNCRGYRYCITVINSTPKSPSNHAKQLKRAVSGCLFKENDDEGERE